MIRNSGSGECINSTFIIRRKPVLLTQVSKASALQPVEQNPMEAFSET
jgi:hypothetical protein